MILTFRPDGQAAQVWEFQLGKLRCQETEAIERRTGMPYGSEFKEKLLQGQVLARRALLWTLLRRTHHTIRFEDIDFAEDELELSFDRDEWQRIHDEVADNAALAEDERTVRLAMIAAEIAKLDAEAAAQPSDEARPEGKAPDAGSASTTG